MLYRAIYKADGEYRAWTFAYDSDEGAVSFAARFVGGLQRFWNDAWLTHVVYAKPARGSTGRLV